MWRCWEGLGAGGEGDNRGWDGWMASPTQWTWVWVNSRSWWWTGRPGVLWFMGSQRVGQTEQLNWAELNYSVNWTEPKCEVNSEFNTINSIYTEKTFGHFIALFPHLTKILLYFAYETVFQTVPRMLCLPFLFQVIFCCIIKHWKPYWHKIMGSQRVRHDWATELNWTELNHFIMLTDSIS